MVAFIDDDKVGFKFQVLPAIQGGDGCDLERLPWRGGSTGLDDSDVLRQADFRERPDELVHQVVLVAQDQDFQSVRCVFLRDRTSDEGFPGPCRCLKDHPSP